MEIVNVTTKLKSVEEQREVSSKSSEGRNFTENSQIYLFHITKSFICNKLINHKYFIFLENSKKFLSTGVGHIGDLEQKIKTTETTLIERTQTIATLESTITTLQLENKHKDEFNLKLEAKISELEKQNSNSNESESNLKLKIRTKNP